MFLQFHGAAEGVTGSLHRIRVNDHDILLDCGLFQGRRAEANQINRDLPEWACKAHALVLSHAHIDHSGNLPTLVKHGFSGNIYCTPPTRDLCSVMLRDSAMLQEQDARYLNDKFAREGSDERIEALYTPDDAQKAVSHMLSIPLYRPLPIAPGVTLTFHNAGHVLGSSLVQLDLEEEGKQFRFLFTGDLGREELPLLKKPDLVSDVNYLLMESTYGDRKHVNLADMDQQLSDLIETTIARKGRVYIPTFALERAQEVLFALERLHERGLLPDVPIYIDSPLAIAITEIYKLHPESLEKRIQARILERNDPFSPPGLRYVTDIATSKKLQREDDPCIIIAGSGMCEGGRIVYHLVKGLDNPKNSIVIVGFMAQHTLGRRLIERRRKVKLLGLERDVRAQIHTVNGLSAHADQTDLVQFATQTAAAGQLQGVALVHGETHPRQQLAKLLSDAQVPGVTEAAKGQIIELSAS